MKVPSGAICTLSLSFNNDGPLGTFFRYICDNGTYIARYDDLVDGKNKPIDVSKVDVSMNGIELQDREFFAAIQEKREPNASVAAGAAGDAHARPHRAELRQGLNEHLGRFGRRLGAARGAGRARLGGATLPARWRSRRAFRGPPVDRSIGGSGPRNPTRPRPRKALCEHRRAWTTGCARAGDPFNARHLPCASGLLRCQCGAEVSR